MRTLVLHPTEMSQWYALVNEAEAATHLMLNENTESYLVFLLMRFSQHAKIIESVIALDFLNSQQNPSRNQAELLRDVGDKSLLFCGLFPGMAKKRRVSLDYFIELGKAAYISVSELDSASKELFFQLARQFLNLQDILRAMRGDILQFSHQKLGPFHPDIMH